MKTIIKNFVCNAGEYSVEITDEKAIELVNKIDFLVDNTSFVRDRFGDKPEHPYDYCDIAYWLYLDEVLTHSDMEYLKKYMLNNCMYKGSLEPMTFDEVMAVREKIN